MRVIAPGMFELRRDESFNINIECEGGAYLAFGTVNTFALNFTPQSPTDDVTPAVLSGPGSVNRIHLHLVYPQDGPAQSYRVTVIDENGQTVDTTNSTLNPDRPRPHRVDFDLVARVQ